MTVGTTSYNWSVSNFTEGTMERSAEVAEALERLGSPQAAFSALSEQEQRDVMRAIDSRRRAARASAFMWTIAAIMFVIICSTLVPAQNIPLPGWGIGIVLVICAGFTLSASLAWARRVRLLSKLGRPAFE